MTRVTGQPLAAENHVCDLADIPVRRGDAVCEVCTCWAFLAACWCGGDVGLREPGDGRGLGCLANVYHDWRTDPPIEYRGTE